MENISARNYSIKSLEYSRDMVRLQKERISNRRNIVTEFYDSKYKKPVWVNRSKNPRQASKNAQDYLHEDTHKAWIAVIYDDETGRLYCIWIRDVYGDVRSAYRCDNFDAKFLTNLPDEWFPSDN